MVVSLDFGSPELVQNPNHMRRNSDHSNLWWTLYDIDFLSSNFID